MPKSIRLLCVAALAACSVSLYGQGMLGVAAGYTMSRFHFRQVTNVDKVRYHSNAFGELSYVAVFPSNFGTKVSFSYAGVGADVGGTDTKGNAFRNKYSLSYIDINGMANYTVPIIGYGNFRTVKLFLDIRAGVFVGIAVSGSVKNISGAAPLSQNPYDFQPGEFYLGMKNPISEGYASSFDLGVLGELSMRLQLFQKGQFHFTYRYNMGLSDIDISDYVRTKNRYSSFFIGYVFLLGAADQ